MKALVNKANPVIRITAPSSEIKFVPEGKKFRSHWKIGGYILRADDWTFVEQEQPEVELEEFTKKMDAWKARFNRPDDIPIKATMAFTARMFYMYPNVARQWYEQLPKTTID